MPDLRETCVSFAADWATQNHPIFGFRLRDYAIGEVGRKFDGGDSGPRRRTIGNAP